MNILHLPVEIGTLIFAYLDTKAKINAFSIKELKQFLAPCLMKKVNISRSTLAASKTLRLDALQVHAGNIEELNLSGVQDLAAEQLIPYLQKCTNLKTLDVTYTRIVLPDVEHIICCASLKNISINYFKWPWTDEVWKKCSDIFKRQMFVRVHFVVLDFYNSESPLRFMEDIPMTKDLKITLADNNRNYSMAEQDLLLIHPQLIDIHFEHLCYIFRDTRLRHTFNESLRGVTNLAYEKIEFIFIMYAETISIYVSHIFRRMFGLNCAYLTLHIRPCLHKLDVPLNGNVIFKAWNKEVTVFDDEFFRNVLSELTDYFPTYICMRTMLPERITDAPSHWYCIDSCDTFNDELLDYLPENVTLADFCRWGSVVQPDRPITLNPELTSMKNITFLAINNMCITDTDFFTILFLQCQKLYTLEVCFGIGDRARTPTLSLLNAIHLTKSLKSLKLILEDIDYEMTFFSLCQCSSLENVHIRDNTRFLPDYEADEQNIMSLIEKCYNLYSLFIEADMGPEALTLLMGTLRTAAQSMKRDHLYLEVCKCDVGRNPFGDVFNPSPLCIVE